MIVEITDRSNNQFYFNPDNILKLLPCYASSTHRYETCVVWGNGLSDTHIDLTPDEVQQRINNQLIEYYKRININQGLLC